ncbi:hypothetical protein GCK72_025293 [Caenorhabditis remanei]|uniref:Uncharacterized protein n=1 Tax=Caenorhabditis remanei TaxID=31234 RepID=A0A6A5G1K5_CAERE|nr:hypothetical protein GCK72_025293 [Caenorhabditis remanei]KAF1748826.1 hypothetical protein GCK72_025293 [Caenorhabditis remanei]
MSRSESLLDTGSQCVGELDARDVFSEFGTESVDDLDVLVFAWLKRIIELNVFYSSTYLLWLWLVTWWLIWVGWLWEIVIGSEDGGGGNSDQKNQLHV